MTEFQMPILSDCRRDMGGLPKTISMPKDCDRRAIKNHGQNLSTLKQRGGVSPEEAIAIMEDRKWRKMTIFEIVDKFREFYWE